MVMSNIPFGNFRVFDKHYSSHPDPVRRASGAAIHNLFFVKGLDSLRDGGLLAYITTRGVADAESNQEYRRWLVDNANLISAIRLPDNLFTEHSGTSAGTDLLVFQKAVGKQSLTNFDELFLKSAVTEEGISCNSLFAGNANAVFSSAAPGTDQYGRPAMVYIWDEDWAAFGVRLAEKLSADMALRFDRDLFRKGQQRDISAVAENPVMRKGDPAGSLFSSGSLLSISAPTASISMARRPFDGAMLSHYQDGTMVMDGTQPGTLDIPWQGKPIFVPLELSTLESLKARDYMTLRDTYKELDISEMESGEANDDARARLMEVYDRFVEYYGELNERDNWRLILSDTLGREVLSLERMVKGEKRLADIFYRPVSFAQKVIEHTDSAMEALAISLNLYGRIEPTLICDLTDRGWEELVTELKERVFYNPMENEFQVREQFVSGDVITKSEEVERRLLSDPDNNEIQRTLLALREAIPAPVPFHDLYLNFGERWIPNEVYERFATELFQTAVHIKYEPLIDEFSLVGADRNALITGKYAVKTQDDGTYDGFTMMRYALYDTIPHITMVVDDGSGNEVRVPDREAQQRAISVTQQIRDEFDRWLTGQDEEFKDDLTDRYNRLFNCYARPEYDGSHLTLSDLNLKGLGYETVHQSQRDAVWMFLLNRGGIADHKVGGGKTLLGCILAHEMKRLGISNKTIIACIKSNVDKFAAEYMTAYPNDKVLYPSERDFMPENRERLFHDMKNNDWDVIILTHEQFGKIPIPADIQIDVMQQELDLVNESLKVYEQMGGEITPRLLKGLETRRKNLTAKIAELNHTMSKRKDSVPDLRQMGVQHIIDDESHHHKNIPFHTRNDRVAGIGNPQGSQRALNMLYASRTLQNDKDMDLQTTSMSGTTITNSLVEMPVREP